LRAIAQRQADRYGRDGATLLNHTGEPSDLAEQEGPRSPSATTVGDAKRGTSGRILRLSRAAAASTDGNTRLREDQHIQLIEERQDGEIGTNRTRGTTRQ
jgi:hypothetical protein